MLIAGDSSAAGVGVEAQQHALSGQLLRALHAAGIGRVHWRLEAASGWSAADLLRQIEVAAPAGFDCVVVVSGVNDVTSDRPLRRWLRTLERIDAVLRDGSPGATLLYTGLPPMHRFPLLPQPLRWYLRRARPRVRCGARAVGRARRRTGATCR